MLDFKRAILATVVLDFLDSYTTYVFITLGMGREANPIIASQVNANPGFVFILFLLYVAVAAALYALWSRLYVLLPVPYRALIDRFVSTMAVIAIAFKSAVVVNNFLGIIADFTPVAYLFEKIGLFG